MSEITDKVPENKVSNLTVPGEAPKVMSKRKQRIEITEKLPEKPPKKPPVERIPEKPPSSRKEYDTRVPEHDDNITLDDAIEFLFEAGDYLLTRDLVIDFIRRICDEYISPRAIDKALTNKFGCGCYGGRYPYYRGIIIKDLDFWTVNKFQFSTN